MKEKIIIFLIGLLAGAVIASGSFLVYTKIANNCHRGPMQMNGGNMPMMQNNNNGNNQPPQMNGNGNQQQNQNGQNNNQPPEKANENNNQ